MSSADVDKQQNFNFAIGLLPRLTIGGRGTIASRDGNDFARDLSASAQLLLLEEGLWWPAVAVGFQDIGGGAQQLPLELPDPEQELLWAGASNRRLRYRA